MEKRSSVEQALACTLSASNDNEETLKKGTSIWSGRQPTPYAPGTGWCVCHPYVDNMNTLNKKSTATFLSREGWEEATTSLHQSHLSQPCGKFWLGSLVRWDWCRQICGCHRGVGKELATQTEDPLQGDILLLSREEVLAWSRRHRVSGAIAPQQERSCWEKKENFLKGAFLPLTR